VYFNTVFILSLAGAWLLTGFEPLLLVAFLLQIEIVHQMLPFLRLDGYYVLSDVAGVPDLFRRIGPVLKSAVPGSKPDPSVAELKPWVRRMVIGWVLVVVPLLLLNLGMIIFNAPRILATAWDSAAKLVYGIAHHSPLMQTVDVLQLLFLGIPILGLAFSFATMGKQAAAGSWRWSSGSAPRRSMVLLGTTAMLGLLALAWWPDGRMTPYRPGEQGTLTQALRSASAVGTGQVLLRSPEAAATQPLPAVAPGTTAGQLADGTAPTTRSDPPTFSHPTGTTPSTAATPATTPGPAQPSATPQQSTAPSPTSAPTPSPTGATSPSPSPTP
jgi:putative peptide zinc metalloprotease protein